MPEYDVIIVGAGPGGIFSAYELMNSGLSVAIIESGCELEKRKCPIDGDKIKSCVNCKSCSIMSGFGGAGAFSDGKYNITNDFGGTLYEHIGYNEALDLMEYVDKINLENGGEGIKLFSSDNSKFSKLCLQNNLKLLNASIRHLGTDINYKILQNLYHKLKTNGIDFYFNTKVTDIEISDRKYINGKPEVCGYSIWTKDNKYFHCKYCIVSAGRSGSSWVEELCNNLDIKTLSNKVDIGVRVELPYEIFSHLTDELYEAKIVYRTEQFEDEIRTFCMNPRGSVVNENTNGVITVNGHAFEDEKLKTNNTNFALLVSKKFTEPFNNSNEYGMSIAKLSNMLGGGVIVQQFGDLKRGRRTTENRLNRGTVKQTLKATPGDLSLVLPKRILDDIIEMIEALDKIAPGTANPSTLLYGVEVKSYNMVVDVNKDLESKYNNLFFIGDGSGITHSLSQASASGVYVARKILERSLQK